MQLYDIIIIRACTARTVQDRSDGPRFLLDRTVHGRSWTVDCGPWFCLVAGPSGRSNTVSFLEHFHVLCSFGTRNNIRKAEYRSSRCFLAVRTLPALKTTVLDRPDRPDGPKSGRSSGLDGHMIPDPPRTVRYWTVQKSWVRMVPILSARASPNYYLSFFFNTKIDRREALIKIL